MPNKSFRQAVDSLRSGISARARVSGQTSADAAKLTASLAEAWLALAEEQRQAAEKEASSPDAVREALDTIQQLTQKANHARQMLRLETDPERKRTLADYARRLEQEAAALASSDAETSGEEDPTLNFD